MLQPHSLAVDLGTSHLKVAVVRADGHVAALCSRPIVTRFDDDGAGEQDADSWWAALLDAGRQVVFDSGVDPVAIVAVSCTSQYMSLVPVAADGTPVGPALMWMDGRGAELSPHLFGPEQRSLWRSRHGLAPFGSDDLCHMQFFHESMPRVYESAATFVEPVDALTARLVGYVTANPNTAFPLLLTNNFDGSITSFDPVLVRAAGVDSSKLPQLVAVGTILGSLQPNVADALGLTASTLVVSGTIDSATSAIGTAAISTNRLGIVIGTTSVVVAHTDRMMLDHRRSLFTAPSAIADRFVLLAENGIGGRAVEHLGGLLSMTTDQFVSLAGHAPPGANGAWFAPWLVGSMAPRPNPALRGSLMGLGLATTTADIARAALEGVALNLAWLVPEVEEFVHERFSSITFGGGAAASPLWAQILADACQLPVRRVSEPRATNARAAGLLALASCGEGDLAGLAALIPVAQIHDPHPEAIYEQARERLIRASEAI